MILNFLKKLFIFINDPILYFRFQNYYLRKFSNSFLKFIFFFKFYNRKKLINDFKNVEFSDCINQEKGFVILNDKKIINISKKAVIEAEKILTNYKKKKNINKSYFIRITEKKDFKKKSEIFQLAKSESILKVVSEYLGIFPILTNINIYYTPTNSAQKIEGSQLFHLDHEDFSQIKCFIYCNDVGQESGPLMIYPKKDSVKLQKKINYKPNQDQKRIKDDLLDSQKINTINSIKGTMILADTSNCFHAGARSMKKSRLMIAFQYLTPFAFVKKIYKEKTYENLLSSKIKFERYLSDFEI